jgi:hypothetical protein
MSDTYEFLKAQKDAIVAKNEAENLKWIEATIEDIKFYKQEIKALETQRDEAAAEVKRKDKAIKEALDELNEFVKAPYLDYCLVFVPIHKLQEALK